MHRGAWIAVAIGISIVMAIALSSRAPERRVTGFEECAAAGNPVMESYPRQCRTPDGRLFVEDVGTISPTPPPVSSTPDETDQEPVFCTADAKQCPDGSWVGRVPPDCRFAPCPGR